MGRLRKTMGRLRKTMGRLGKTRGRYNPQNDGVGFFKTMGFISQNDAYIFEGFSHPSFLWFSAVLFLVFRGSVLWLSDSFLFDFFFSSWFCLVVLILCVLLRQEIAFGVQRRVAYSEVLLLSLFLFFTCLIKSCASEMLCSTKSPQSYSLTII